MLKMSNYYAIKSTKIYCESKFGEKIIKTLLRNTFILFKWIVPNILWVIKKSILKLGLISK